MRRRRAERGREGEGSTEQYQVVREENSIQAGRCKDGVIGSYLQSICRTELRDSFRPNALSSHNISSQSYSPLLVIGLGAACMGFCAP